MSFLYLLDTNTLSDFIKGIDPALTQKMRRAMKAQSVCTSALCRAELRYGQALMAASDKRRTMIDLLLTEMPALAWTTAAADTYGAVKAALRRSGTPIGELDTQIAAHAMAENLTLITHNTRHFSEVPHLRIQDWRA